MAKHLSSWGAKRLNNIRESLWSLPVLITLAGVALAVFLPWLDRRLFGTDAQKLSRLLPSPSSAEALLSTGAGALATVLGVAFSLTIVTLQLAASQYTSRIIRRFMADLITRGVLGMLLGTAAYLAVLLRAIDPAQQGSAGFVPPISLGFALVSFITCLLLLAVFIHHMGRSIQASVVIAAAGRDAISSLQDSEERHATRKVRTDAPAGRPCQVTAATPGYLQLVDEEALICAAPDRCLIIRVEAPAGQFLLPGRALVSFWPEVPLSEETVKKVREACALGRQRTMHQDTLLGMRQLVDIVLKALSPGINDITTALLALNELGAVVHQVMYNPNAEVSGYREVKLGRITLLMPRVDLEMALAHAFDEVPRAASNHPMVLARTFEVLTELAAGAPNEEAKRLVLEAGDRVRAFVEPEALKHWEQEILDRRYRMLRQGQLGAPDSIDPI